MTPCPICQQEIEDLDSHLKSHGWEWPDDDWTDNMPGPDAEGWREIRKV